MINFSPATGGFENAETILSNFNKDGSKILIKTYKFLGFWFRIGFMKGFRSSRSELHYIAVREGE
jgi:hypothetical protein